jgi:hypothetical protein
LCASNCFSFLQVLSNARLGSENALRIKRAIQGLLVRKQIRIGAVPKQQGPCVPVPELSVESSEALHSRSARSELALLLLSEVAHVVLLLDVVGFLADCRLNFAFPRNVSRSFESVFGRSAFRFVGEENLVWLCPELLLHLQLMPRLIVGLWVEEGLIALLPPVDCLSLAQIGHF